MKSLDEERVEEIRTANSQVVFPDKTQDFLLSVIDDLRKENEGLHGYCEELEAQTIPDLRRQIRELKEELDERPLYKD